MMLGPTGSPQGGRGPDPAGTPPDYRSGFGDAGAAALEAFVENGGTLVTFAQAGDLVLDEFDVPVRNAVAGMWGSDFWAPGSTLKVKVDTSSPFAYGMPGDALAAYLAGGQVYETVPGARSSDVRRIVTYIDRDILQSGWLLGEEAIANKAAMVSVQHGEGTIVMIGFRAQHRAQTHGTFKLLFNALVGWGSLTNLQHPSQLRQRRARVRRQHRTRHCPHRSALDPLGHAPRLGYEQHSRTVVPGCQPGLPEAVQDAVGDVREVDRGGARAAHPGGAAQGPVEFQQVRGQQRVRLEGEARAEQESLDPPGPADANPARRSRARPVRARRSTPCRGPGPRPRPRGGPRRPRRLPKPRSRGDRAGSWSCRRAGR